MAPKAAEVMDEAVKKLQQTTREWKSTMEAASEDPSAADLTAVYKILCDNNNVITRGRAKGLDAADIKDFAGFAELSFPARSILKLGIAAVQIATSDASTLRSVATPQNNREFPTQMCHGTIAALSATSWKLVTPSERFCGLGFHALPAVCTQWPECDLMRILRAENISKTSLHKLTGNGMHLASQAAWMTYVISHCALRSWFESSPRTVPEPSSLEECPGVPEKEEVSNSQATDLFDHKEPVSAPCTLDSAMHSLAEPSTPDCLDPNCPDLRGPDGLLLQTLDGFDDEVVQEPGSEDKLE